MNKADKFSPILQFNLSYRPIIYDHIIRGYNKSGNFSGFDNGLKNHYVELKVEGSTAKILIHYFNSTDSHIGVIETIIINN